MALKGIFTTEELAEYLALKPQTLRLWRTQGTGPRFLKIQNRTKYREEDIEEWLAKKGTFASTEEELATREK